MSVVDQLKNLFGKKEAEPSIENSGELSLAMPDASLDPMATGSMEHSQTLAMRSADPDSVDEDSLAPLDAVDEADLISIPLLGRRSIVTHQRILFILLAISLAVLGGVAIIAVRQADTVAQQVA